MAELLFRYMSDCKASFHAGSEAPRKSTEEGQEKKKEQKKDAGEFENLEYLNSARVNYLTFLQKFDVIWPKKQE